SMTALSRSVSASVIPKGTNSAQCCQRYSLNRLLCARCAQGARLSNIRSCCGSHRDAKGYDLPARYKNDWASLARVLGPRCATSRLMHRSNCVVIRSPGRPHHLATAMACSELFVESVLDEVIQHPVGLKRRRRIKLGNALHQSFFFGKGVQPTTKIEHLPVGSGAVHLGL